MEADKQTTNPRPSENSSLPAITLIVLVGLIAALLYVGYEYISDDTNGSDELTNVALDTTSQQPLAQDNPEMLMAPEEVDTSSQPAPVDLSQAEPPADAPEANAKAEEVAEGNRETPDGKPAPSEKPEAKKPEPVKAEVVKPAPVKTEVVKKEEKPKVEKPKEEEVAVVKPTIKPGGVSRAYTVGAGETFYGVANRYNMTVTTLKALNPGVSESDVKAGITKLNVKVLAVHTVVPGRQNNDLRFTVGLVYERK